MIGPPLAWDPGPPPASPKAVPVLLEFGTFILGGSWVTPEGGQGKMGKKGDKREEFGTV